MDTIPSPQTTHSSASSHVPPQDQKKRPQNLVLPSSRNMRALRHDVTAPQHNIMQRYPDRSSSTQQAQINHSDFHQHNPGFPPKPPLTRSNQAARSSMTGTSNTPLASLSTISSSQRPSSRSETVKVETQLPAQSQIRPQLTSSRHNRASQPHRVVLSHPKPIDGLSSSMISAGTNANIAHTDIAKNPLPSSHQLPPRPHHVPKQVFSQQQQQQGQLQPQLPLSPQQLNQTSSSVLSQKQLLHLQKLRQARQNLHNQSEIGGADQIQANSHLQAYSQPRLPPRPQSRLQLQSQSQPHAQPQPQLHAQPQPQLHAQLQPQPHVQPLAQNQIQSQHDHSPVSQLHFSPPSSHTDKREKDDLSPTKVLVIDSNGFVNLEQNHAFLDSFFYPNGDITYEQYAAFQKVSMCSPILTQTGFLNETTVGVAPQHLFDSFEGDISFDPPGFGDMPAAAVISEMYAPPAIPRYLAVRNTQLLQQIEQEQVEKKIERKKAVQMGVIISACITVLTVVAFSFKMKK